MRLSAPLLASLDVAHLAATLKWINDAESTMPTDFEPASESEAHERDADVASSGLVGGGGGAGGPSWSLLPRAALELGRSSCWSCAQGACRAVL